MIGVLNRFTKEVCHLCAKHKESTAHLFIKCVDVNVLPAGGSRRGKIHHSPALLMKQIVPTWAIQFILTLEN